MKFRFQPWQLAAILIVLCAAAIWLLDRSRDSRSYDATSLLGCLPQDRAVKVYLDVGRLRSSGLLDLLAGARAAEEPDYRDFVRDTGFDYRSDLDAVAGTFVQGDDFFALRGHFDWKKLSAYARSHMGQCLNSICTMPGSQPNRHISFYPLSGNVLALAVSAQDRAVVAIAWNSVKSAAVPPVPLWISAPAPVFRDLSGWPAGFNSLLSPLADTEEVQFSVQPPAGAAAKEFEIRLDAECPTAAGAHKLADEFGSRRDLLRSMLARDRLTPNPADLSGLLVAGQFQSHDTHFAASWPVDSRLFQALVAGTAP